MLLKRGYLRGGPSIGGRIAKTYQLPAVAVRKACSMLKSVKRSWSMIIEGKCTPATRRAPPKTAPETRVGM